MAKAKPVQDRVTSLACYPEVKEKLRLGWSVADVARIIQEDHKELISLSRKSLEKALLHLRTGMKPGEVAETLLPEFVKNAAEVIEAGLDEVKELERLYKIQLRRIEMGASTEESLKILLNTTGQEIRIAKEILDSLGKRKGDLGLRAPQVIDVNVSGSVTNTEKTVNQSVLVVMDDSESRKKVLALANRLLMAGSRVDQLPEVVPGASDIIDIKES